MNNHDRALARAFVSSLADLIGVSFDQAVQLLVKRHVDRLRAQLENDPDSGLFA